MTRFGTIISADVLEDDMTIYLKKWFDTYAAEVAQQRGDTRGDYPSPRYWTTTPILTVDTIAQVRYPAVLIVSPGLTGKPMRRGDGSFEASYQIGVCILASTRTEAGSSRSARRLGAAIHTAVMQHPSMDTSYIESVEWADERFTDFLNADQETVASATEIFNITCKGVFNALRGPGPAYPNPLPEPAVYPDVTTVRDPAGPSPYTPVPPIIPIP